MSRSTVLLLWGLSTPLTAFGIGCRSPSSPERVDDSRRVEPSSESPPPEPSGAAREPPLRVEQAPAVQGGERCGEHVCATGQTCCRLTCQVCIPLGASCSPQLCAAAIEDEGTPR